MLGAAAYDVSDGRLPAYQILTTGLSSVNTNSAPASFLIRYDATGANCAPSPTPAYRTVAVVDPCPAPEHTCPGSLVCSVLGTCVLLPLGAGAVAAVAAVAAAPDTTPPTITLRGPGVVDTASGVMVTNATVGQSFADPGATAMDNVDGDITSRMLASISSPAGVVVAAVDVSAPTGSQGALLIS